MQILIVTFRSGYASLAQTSASAGPVRQPISNEAITSENLPARLKLLAWGENKTVRGPVRVSNISTSLLPVNQTARGYAEVALDFEHNTVPGTDEYNRTQEPRPVAAYGTPRIVPGEGLFLENVRWTPGGKASALNFADLSPAVEMDADGNVVFVHSAALTRNGAVEGLSFFSAQPFGLTGIDRAVYAHGGRIIQFNAPSKADQPTGLARAIAAARKASQ